jgi:hypothetical protein
MIQHSFSVPATITPLTGDRDASGERIFGEPISTFVAVVGLSSSYAATNLGSSTSGLSASRGSAWENTASTRFLLSREEVINIGDKLDVAGLSLRVSSVFPRYDIDGILDHLQVDAKPWE